MTNFPILDEHMCDFADMARNYAKVQQAIWDNRPPAQEVEASDIRFDTSVPGIFREMEVWTLGLLCQSNHCCFYETGGESHIIGLPYDVQAVQAIFGNFLKDFREKVRYHFPVPHASALQTPGTLEQYFGLACYWLASRYEEIALLHSQHERMLHFQAHVDTRIPVMPEFQYA